MDRAPRRRARQSQYLIAYNFLSAILWLSVLGRVVLLVPLVGLPNVYVGVGRFAKWTQTIAVAEVGHVLFGLIRAPLPTTAMQVASRLLLVWGIVDLFPRATGASPAYSSMLLAWSMSEVIRYSYFVLFLRGGMAGVPRWLSWLRYNAFFILYPLGISSECWLVYKALPAAQKWDVRYEYFLWVVLLTYIPGSYILYTHMMAQRRRILRGKGREGSA